jgi:DNA-binding NtrC family response regulator
MEVGKNAQEGLLRLVETKRPMARLVGDTPAMRSLRERIERVAPTESTVLIEGETGVGKEVVAQALHDLSGRASHGLYVIDCGTLPADLTESELFGHERGAFTGATSSCQGPFECARGGTLLLDEIGELPMAMQPRLLRVLESRAIRRVGGRCLIPIDVRVIAATHRDLAYEVGRGRFREDLYYRLEVISLTIPPLRTRRDDLPGLAAHILRELGAVPEEHLTSEAMPILLAHDWPGNVRELRNTLERAAALHEPVCVAHSTRSREDELLPEKVDLEVPFRRGRSSMLRAYEVAYLSGMLARCGGNVSEAARRAGLERGSLYRILRRIGRVDELTTARLRRLGLSPSSLTPVPGQQEPVDDGVTRSS